MLVVLRYAFSLMLALTLFSRCGALPRSGRTAQSAVKLTRKFSVLSVENTLQTHENFMKSTAKIEPPKRLKTLLELLDLKGEELVNPRARAGMNPFLIPVSRSKEDGQLTCYIRWPTQKEDMEQQLVRTTDAGIQLLALNTDNYCHRLAVELDFDGSSDAEKAAELLNRDGELYKIGDYLPFLKSGKFPAITEHDLRLVLDRYLLTKVGSFPDCYERLATNFEETGNEVSALVTCERAVSVFYSWGHPIHFHTNMLRKLGRELESKDSARASMGMPMFTIARNMEELQNAAELAGFSSTKILGEMHAFRANDPREKEVGEGLSPIQVTLDQAAHLMDAVTLGNIEGGWDTARPELSRRYREGGYPEMADFIETVE
mmetsp:Transcript_14041/g.23377  ORF Transcript_14041/g.23377 Transcript_14041/m.23377 type:complete len:375 (+) Transcript_14041:9-1133(+)